MRYDDPRTLNHIAEFTNAGQDRGIQFVSRSFFIPVKKKFYITISSPTASFRRKEVLDFCCNIISLLISSFEFPVEQDGSARDWLLLFQPLDSLCLIQQCLLSKFSFLFQKRASLIVSSPAHGHLPCDPERSSSP